MSFSTRSFDGLAANIEGGDTWKDDHRSLKGELSYGSDFDGDRGHLIGSVSYLNSPDTLFVGQRSWYKNTKLVNNPGLCAGQWSAAIYSCRQCRTFAGDPGRLDHRQSRPMPRAPMPMRCAASSLSAQWHARAVQFRKYFGRLFERRQRRRDRKAMSIISTIPMRSFTFFGYGSYKLTRHAYRRRSS